jgi:RNA polymerase primary sigma factor
MHKTKKEISPTLDIKKTYEPSDALSIYLREINAIPRLSLAEEKKYVLKIKKSKKPFSAAVRRHIILANLRLVVNIAKRYQGNGVSLLDLISEGNIGLVKAVKEFDVTRGMQLRNYVGRKIKLQILLALCNQSKTIRLPKHVSSEVREYRRTMEDLYSQLQREPTVSEIAEIHNVSTWHVQHFLSISTWPSSIHQPIDDNGDTTLGDLISDNNDVSPFQIVDNDTVNSFLSDAIMSLAPREAYIIRERFGLNDGVEKTLEEVGQKLHVTRERIRQLIRISLGKIRAYFKAHNESTLRGGTVPTFNQTKMSSVCPHIPFVSPDIVNE